MDGLERVVDTTLPGDRPRCAVRQLARPPRSPFGSPMIFGLMDSQGTSWNAFLTGWWANKSSLTLDLTIMSDWRECVGMLSAGSPAWSDAPDEESGGLARRSPMTAYICDFHACT
jgi:hypothetical protein